MKKLDYRQLSEKADGFITLFDKLVNDAEKLDDTRTRYFIHKEFRSVVQSMKGLFLHSNWAATIPKECDDHEAFMKSRWRTPNLNYKKEYLAGYRDIMQDFREYLLSAA